MSNDHCRDGESFDLTAYLDRIGLHEPPPATVEGLMRIQRAHRLAIPFENFDIILGKGISLDRDAIFDKLVRRRRGGYCFEQNALFELALDALGFEVRPLLARVWLAANGAVPPVTHQLELITVEGASWIADAGFGGSFVLPMLLTEAEGAVGPDGVRHRLKRDASFDWMLERIGSTENTDGRTVGGPEWQPQYSFSTGAVHPVDQEQCNHWTSTRPGTRFTTMVIASRVTADGFVSLTGRELRVSETGGVTSRVLETPDALGEALLAYFDITLPPDDIGVIFGRA